MKRPHIVILIPIYEDFLCLPILFSRIDQTLKNICSYEILVIDDGSLKNIGEKKELFNSKNINVLTLSQNVGHQRSITIGLCHLSERKDFDFVLIMDGDGEDNPLDAKKLLEKATNHSSIIFARREVRSEPLLFRLGYFIYRIVFRVCTGKNIKFGNFSLVPSNMLERLTGIPELWNHYASGVMVSKLPFYEVATERSGRINGRPKMNVFSLVLHGIGSITNFIKDFALRLSLFLTFTLLTSITLKIVSKFDKYSFLELYNISDLIIILSIITFQSYIFLISTISKRSNAPCIPSKFWKFFITK